MIVHALLLYINWMRRSVLYIVQTRYGSASLRLMRSLRLCQGRPVWQNVKVS